MHARFSLPFRCLIAGIVSLSLPCFDAQAHDVAGEMAISAKALLQSLTPEQRAKATYKLEDAERINWHFIPRQRNGLPLKELNPDQRALMMALVQTGMSEQGMQKATTIMSLEGLLREMEKSRVGGPVRDPEMYFISVFGQPDAKSAWGWRFEGHHMSLNFSNADGAVVSMTPSFFGSNPGEVREGEKKGLRVLGAEEELGRELVKMLDETQRKKAVILEKAPADILNMPGRNEWTNPEGVSYADLNDAQKAQLTKLIREYLERHRKEVAADEWAIIEKEGLEKIHFAWAGGFERNMPHYYRVQGVTFIMEYDNTQNGANHVHCAWRDRTREFGGDVLTRHYQKAH